MNVMKNKDLSDPSQLKPTVDSAEPKADESGVAAIEEIAEEVDDAEWLKRRQAQAAGKVAETVPTAAAVEDKKPASNLSTEESQILSTGRLFIRNLSFLTTPEDISSAFASYGALEEVHLPVSQTSKQPLGTAFLQFKDPKAAVEAWREMDGRTLMGRLVHILPGRPKHGAAAAEADAVITGRVMGKDTERNVKADIDKKRKEQSGKGLNWATLYMNVSRILRRETFADMP
jgi:multiple RNA-binding domain-containing protein 1